MAEYDNVSMLGDEDLFAPDPLYRQKTLSAKVRQSPALAVNSSGASLPPPTPAPPPEQMQPTPQAAASAGPAPGTYAHTLDLIQKNMAQRPDYTGRKQDANRKLVLGMALGMMGDTSSQPIGHQLASQGLKDSSVDYDEKVREDEQKRLVAMANAQLAAETRREASESSNALRATMAAMKPAPQERLVPVYDPETQTTSYLPASQAAGRQAPPKGAAATGGRPLTTHAVDQITKNDAKVAQFGNLASSWKSEYGGLGTNIGNVHGRYNPLASDESREQAQWWQNYQEVVNDVRHGQFGAALTPTEKAEFEKAIITPQTDPRLAGAYLKRQAELAEIARRRHLENFGKAGFNVSGFIEGDGGVAPRVRDATAPGAPPPGAVREKK